MTPGPKPKPKAIRVFEGNAGNVPLNENEPTPEVLDESADPSDWLGGEAEYMQLEKFPQATVALKIWNEMAPMLSRLGVLTEADRGLLSRYCDIFARWLKMKSFIDRHGESYPVYGTLYEQEKQEDGSVRTVCKKILKQMRVFPQFNAYIKLQSELKNYEAQFGVGAANRTRIQTIVESDLGKNPADRDDDGFDYARQDGLKRVK